MGIGGGMRLRRAGLISAAVACAVALAVASPAMAAPPTVSITDGPSGATNNPQPTFTFTSQNASELHCSIDQGTPAEEDCTGATSYTPSAPLADGAWTFRVRAVSGTDEATDSRSFVVDTVAPSASIDSGPAATTSDTTPTFSFSSSSPERVTFTCWLHQQGSSPPAFAACSGPGQTDTPASPLTDGHYTIEVRATDDAGNSFTASRDFTVDSRAPVISVDSGPVGPTANPTPVFGFSADEVGVAFSCRIWMVGQSQGGFGVCSGPGRTHVPASALADGTYVFEARATDAAGNQATSSRTFTVDTTAPTVSVDSGPNGQTLDETPRFSFSADEPVTFACRLGTGDFVACTGPGQTFVPGAIPDGRYTFEVRATDTAGNQATSSRSFNLTAAACRLALKDVIAANGVYATAAAKLEKAKASRNAKKIKKARKALRKAMKAEAGAKQDVNQSCVTSDA